MRRNLFLLSVALFIAGCGPKVTLAPEYATEQPKIFAFLPIKAEPSVRRERLQYLRGVVASQLQSRGLFLLDDRVVNRHCQSPNCMNHLALAQKYPLDGFITLEINSLSRTNFGLGFYNAIDGTLRIADRADRELLQVEHTESERGGLVFDSGQVIQGIKDSIENLGDDSFNKLAGKFASTISAKVPSYNSDAKSNQAIDVAVNSIQVKELKPSVFSVCASGTPNGLASLVIGRQKTNLREISQGQYCGTYRLSPAMVAADTLALELRSPFGTPIRRPVQVNNLNSL